MLSTAMFFRRKGNRSRGEHTCVAILGLGEEGVYSAHGGSKDVGRRETEGRASQRKDLLEGPDSSLSVPVLYHNWTVWQGTPGEEKAHCRCCPHLPRKCLT